MDESWRQLFLCQLKQRPLWASAGERYWMWLKYIAFLNNLPFISVPTSAAHDGFASSGCSLYIHGRRTSVPARIPYGIIVDIGVIKAARSNTSTRGLGISYQDNGCL
jgi:hypothetical protein